LITLPTTNKRRKLAIGGKIAGPPAEEDGPLRPTNPMPQQRLLYHQNIMVKLDDPPAGASKHVVVGVGAILNEAANTMADADIRCGHLSFESFTQLIRALDEVYDIRDRSLWYEERYTGGRSTQIQDEEGFRNAVGVLMLQSRPEREDRALVMRMQRKRSGAGS
jgi:hypothetical protein